MMNRFCASSSASADVGHLSVILPTFNGSRLICHAIEHCRHQTLRDWELIVVDDGSTDDTPRILADLCTREPRLRVIRHDANRGLPAALNTGFAAARGELLTWTSDDNWYRPTALAVMAAELDRHPHIGVVYADYTLIDECNGIEREITVGDRADLVFGNAIGPCFLYRRSVQTALQGYSEAHFLAEDLDFWLRAAARFEFKPIHENLYCYLRHARSLTETRKRQIARVTDAVILRALPNLPWLTPPQRAEAWWNLARRAATRGLTRRQWRFWLQGILAAPTYAMANLIRRRWRQLAHRFGPGRDAGIADVIPPTAPASAGRNPRGES